MPGPTFDPFMMSPFLPGLNAYRPPNTVPPVVPPLAQPVQEPVTPGLQPSPRLQALAHEATTGTHKASTMSRLCKTREQRSVGGMLKNLCGGNVKLLSRTLEDHRGEVLFMDAHGNLKAMYERGPDGEWRGFDGLTEKPLGPGHPQTPAECLASMAQMGHRFTAYSLLGWRGPAGAAEETAGTPRAETPQPSDHDDAGSRHDLFHRDDRSFREAEVRTLTDSEVDPQEEAQTRAPAVVVQQEHEHA